jgi:hypothetical protein
VKKAGIGSHTKPNNGETNIWLTPPEIIQELGPFDLDPCAAPSPRPWPTAKHHIELPDNGLDADWFGRVWLNPPYGTDTALWLEKMVRGRHRGIALIFARTETDTWQKWVWEHANGVLFVAGRLYFYLPDGTKAKGNAGGPSALVAYSQEEAWRLQWSKIPGTYIGNGDVCGPEATYRNGLWTNSSRDKMPFEFGSLERECMAERYE